MNKTDLITHIANNAGVSKTSAGRVIEAFVGAIKAQLCKDGRITLIGFGTFQASQRPARMGRNPGTGEKIEIKARKAPIFRPGKGLKDALN